jgi:protein-disulfide isomerase
MNLEKLYIPIAIVIAGLMIAGGLFLGAHSVTRVISPLPAGSTANTTMQASAIRPVSADDHILGNPNADVVIVEYSDTECPFCKSFYSTLQQIMKDYGTSGQVAWVYRHFPIADLHSRAPKEAEATECAYDQGGNDAFWKYLTAVYTTTNSNDTLDPAQLPKIASQIGLDVNTFNTCLSSGKFTAKVQADYDNAVASGGQGTPHTILVTKDGSKLPIEGETTYSSLKSTIDLLLGKTVTQ